MNALQGALRRLALLAEKKPFALPGCNLIVAPTDLDNPNKCCFVELAVANIQRLNIAVADKSELGKLPLRNSRPPINVQVPCTAMNAFIMAMEILLGSNGTTAPLRRMI